MWNLLSIVREMFRRNDRNSIPLLEIITLQCLEIVQILVWWFNTKVALNSARGLSTKQVNSNSQASQNACSSLCDEIVTLWKLAALNPCISPRERRMLRQRLIDYHIIVVEKIQANQTSTTSSQGASSNSTSHSNSSSSSKNNRKPSDLELFPGFKSAIEACMLDWDDYPISGVTFGQNSHYLTPFAVFKLDEGDQPQSQVTSSPAVLRCEYPGDPMGMLQHHHNKQEEQQQQQEANEAKGQLQQLHSLSSETGNNSDEGVGEELAQEALPVEAPESSNGTSEANGAIAVQSGSSDNNELSEDTNGRDDHANAYEVYYYDVKDIPASSRPSGSSNSKSKVDPFKNLRTISDVDQFEVLFMRAEGIYAHGYHSHACKMAVSLAQDLLKSPPDLTLPTHVVTEATGAKGKKKRIAAASHTLTHKASTTLSHCAFLCTVLSDVPEYHSLAFQVGMFGIEMTRLPASTKPMEVKLAHQESELVALLKKIPLGPQELALLRERATYIRDGSRDGTLRLRGEALLPMMLASYTFESLVTSHNPLQT